MYDETNTAILVNKYLDAEDKDAIIDELALQFDKPVRSIIGKLSKEKVYIKKTYKTKSGTDPVTKKEIIMHISLALGADPEKLQGLIKTPKPELTHLKDLISKL
jgi:hypothetical protein